MRVHEAVLLAAVLVLGASSPGSAQRQLEVDLADLDPGSHSMPREEASLYSVVVRNRIVNTSFRYALHVSVRRRVIAAISLPGDTQAIASVRSSKCDPVHAATAAIFQAETEQEVKNRVAFAEAILKNPDFKTCAEIDPLESAVAATRPGYPIDRQVQGDDDVIVRVVRTRDGADPQEWVITYEGNDRGQWLTTYGFSFITDGFTRDKSYSTQEVAGSDGLFAIKETDSNAKLSFVPSLMVSWIPARRDDLQWVFSGGLGFDLTEPVVMLSPIGLNYNRNLTLHIGLAAAKVSRLLTQYEVGQEIGENLTADQLRERVYRLNPFVSLSFNLSSNPFGTAGTGGKGGETEESP